MEPTESTEFSWESEPVVVEEVEAVAVYKNPQGRIVIRQKDFMGDEDSFIFIHQQHVDKLIAALRAIKKS